MRREQTERKPWQHLSCDPGWNGKWQLYLGAQGQALKCELMVLFRSFSSAWNLHPCCPIFLFSVDLLQAHKIIDRGTKSKNISHALRLLLLLLIVVGEVQLTFGGSLKVINYCLRVNFGARVQWKIGKQSSQQPRTPRRNVWECINIYVQNQIQHHNPSAVLIYGEEKNYE